MTLRDQRDNDERNSVERDGIGKNQINQINDEQNRKHFMKNVKYTY